MSDRAPRRADDVRAATAPSPFGAVLHESPPPATHVWHYPPAQYELGTLHHLVATGRTANPNAHYPDGAARPERAVRFRRPRARGEDRIELLASGTLECTLDGQPVPLERHEHGWVARLPAGGRLIEASVQATDGPAAIGEPLPGSAWDYTVGDGDCGATAPRPGGVVPPHNDDEPTVVVPTRRLASDLIETEATVLGRLVLHATERPVVSSGESVAEARAGSSVAETDHAVVQAAPGRWTTTHRLGFRYLAVGGAETSVEVHASFRRSPLRGAFTCSDPVLSRIWSTAAYTSRLCMQRLMLDGVKRDRMPWMGDQALSILVNAFTTADSEIIRDGLVALGRLRHGYVNGIADYSLWWVIAHDTYWCYFADLAYLTREADHLHAFVADLSRHADADGTFRPAHQPDGFGDAGPGSVFLDWGVTVEPGRDPVALQMLWLWALRSAVTVLTAAGHGGADRWRLLAERLGRTLWERAWDPRRQAWRGYLDDDDVHNAGYANFLAVLSDIHGPTTAPAGVVREIAHAEAGTPFMLAWALRSLGAGGERGEAVDRVRELWGGMLEHGATTFWEEFADPQGDPYTMYGRPFGKSLAHAWSAGPAALLPELVLGTRPTAPGWRRFTVSPALGELRWAAAVVPTPNGDLVVSADHDGTHVVVPAGTVLEHGDREVLGPAEADL